VTLVLLVAGLLAIGVGVISLRQADDRSGVPLMADLLAGLRGERAGPARGTGLFVAFEGGDGAGKSTQVAMLAHALTERGIPVTTTREPGATAAGAALRQLLLDPQATLVPRAEALLYAADRADHVERVLRPAQARGDVVVTDRYADSSIAYQGGGRDLDFEEVARLSRWATQGLRPDVTVLLDVDPEVGRSRRDSSSAAPDRVEGEPADFHQRVRRRFLALAEADPRRYLVVPADLDPREVHGRVLDRLEPLLPSASTATRADRRPGPAGEHRDAGFRSAGSSTAGTREASSLEHRTTGPAAEADQRAVGGAAPPGDAAAGSAAATARTREAGAGPPDSSTDPAGAAPDTVAW
jgi:dTMP kinase